MARISLISRNFPPLSGGMERLVHELYRGLVKEHDVTLFGPAGCEDFVEPGHSVWSTTVAPTPLFLIVSFFKGLYARITGGSFDVVIGGSGLVGPIVVVLAKVSGAKSILLLHGLDIIADSRAYQWFFVPFLRRADMAICNSKNTARLAVEHGIREERIAIVNPGVDQHIGAISRESARQTLGVAANKVLLSVGRLMPRKGLAEFVEHCFVKLCAREASWQLLVAGGEPSQALNQPTESVLAKLESNIVSHGLQDRVRLLGHASDAELATLYAAADVFVFPLIETKGDVEGFGMVAVEAAMYGTPTVAFDCGGVADAVTDGINGALVPAGDYAAFGEAVTRVAAQDLRQSSQAFATKFSWENYSERIERCLHKLIA
ncbi:MAG: glycosyltransferase family 4 protein [Woeseiaceae bacterium]